LKCVLTEKAEAVDVDLKRLHSLLSCRLALQLFYRGVADWTAFSIASGTKALKTEDSASIDLETFEKLNQQTASAVKNLQRALMEVAADFGIPSAPPSTSAKKAPSPPPASADTTEALAVGDVLSHADHEDLSFAYSSTLAKVSQNTPVRSIKLKSFFQSVRHLQAICEEVRLISSVAAQFATSASLDYEALLMTSIDFSGRRLHLLSRSLYHAVVCVVAANPCALIERSMRARGVPGSIVSNEEVRDNWMRLSLGRVVIETLRSLSLTRNKLLTKLDSVLARWGQAMDEAMYLDQVFRESFQITDARTQYCSFWVMLSSLQLMDLQMALTLESRLLGTDELDYFYWYWDYICTTRALNIERLRELRHLVDMFNYEQDMLNAAAEIDNSNKNKAAGGAKGKGKGGKSTAPPAVSLPSRPPPSAQTAEELVIRCRGQVCRGVFRQMVVAAELGLVKTHESKYTSAEGKFQQRFRAFDTIRYPAMLSYEAFLMTLNNGKDNGTGLREKVDLALVSDNAAICFGIARQCVDIVRKTATEQQQTNSPPSLVPVTALEAAERYATQESASLLKVNDCDKIVVDLLSYAPDNNVQHSDAKRILSCKYIHT
jgi:hypothetical protein